MICFDYAYSNHAIAQMFKRDISPDQVEEAIKNGERIKEYPQDKPFPSYLLLYTVNQRPLHVVVSQDVNSGICYVITAYVPDPFIWDAEFKNKK